VPQRCCGLPRRRSVGQRQHEAPRPGLQHYFGGKCDRGELSCLTCLCGRNRRPSPQCLRLLPLLGKLHQTRSWLNRSPLAANQRCRLCSRGIGPYRWILGFVSNETLAEDLLSEVFLDLWRQAGRFQRRSSVSTWLLAIARYKALSACRRRTQGAELDKKIEATIADPADDPEVALQEKDRGELVRRALMRLSPQHREVIDLVYYHEKSVDEVAHITEARGFYAVQCYRVIENSGSRKKWGPSSTPTSECLAHTTARVTCDEPNSPSLTSSEPP
jgi:RNA polymerase sigma factor (sigma-70 family)